MQHSTRVEIAGAALKNPVMTASGTFGSGQEFADFIDLNELGAVVTKGVAPVPWPGNPTPRICETPSGMLNAIGLQNPGIDTFIERDLKFLEETLRPGADCKALSNAAAGNGSAGSEEHSSAAPGNGVPGVAPDRGVPGTRVVVNVCGHSKEEYLAVVERLAEEKRADLLEINISCPNVKEGGIAFGTNPKSVEEITAAVKAVAKQKVIMKLSPNVTDITEIARAAEAGGADALSMINTITGMKIDVRRRKFALANRTGGLSGPAIHPVAVRMVWQCAQCVKIPIIGMGGIQTAEDALEMIMAGATAVSVGTASFHDPRTAVNVAAGIRQYLEDNSIADIRELIGCVR